MILTNQADIFLYFHDFFVVVILQFLQTGIVEREEEWFDSIESIIHTNSNS